MVDIIIVNWNSGRQLLDAINSISAFDSDLVGKVVIVDNNSTDDSLKNIERNFDKINFSIELVRNSTNIGFGAACNQGVKLSTGKYVLLLNPDARLFAQSLSMPVAYMQNPENSDVGICGIQLIDENGHISRTCARFPSVAVFSSQALGLNKFPGLQRWSHHMAEWDHLSTREVDHVIGAFYLIRRSLFESLNGFDERFFVYLEDLDLSLRARQAGWRSVYLASVQAFHAGGGTSQQVKATRLFYSLRSRLLYGFKHFAPLRAWALVGVTLLVEPVSRSIFSLIRGGPEDVRNTLKGYGMLWRALPAILKVRRT